MTAGGIAVLAVPDHALQLFGVAAAASIVFAAVMAHRTADR